MSQSLSSSFKYVEENLNHVLEELTNLLSNMNGIPAKLPKSIFVLLNHPNITVRARVYGLIYPRFLHKIEYIRCFISRTRHEVPFSKINAEKILFLDRTLFSLYSPIQEYIVGMFYTRPIRDLYWNKVEKGKDIKRLLKKDKRVKMIMPSDNNDIIVSFFDLDETRMIRSVELGKKDTLRFLKGYRKISK